MHFFVQFVPFVIYPIISQRHLSIYKFNHEKHVRHER